MNWDSLSCTNKDAGIFFRRGVPNLQNGGVDKTATTPISATKILWTPITDRPTPKLPPKQAKIVLISVFLNKINTFSVVISGSSYDPPIFLSKNLWPQYIWDPPLLKTRNASPLNRKTHALVDIALVRALVWFVLLTFVFWKTFFFFFFFSADWAELDITHLYHHWFLTTFSFFFFKFFMGPCNSCCDQ